MSRTMRTRLVLKIKAVEPTTVARVMTPGMVVRIVVGQVTMTTETEIMALEAMPHQVMTTPREAIDIPLIVTMTPMEARTVKMMPMEARMRINPTEARMRMTLMEERMRMTTMKAKMTMNLTEARMTMNPTEARMIHLTASKAGTT